MQASIAYGIYKRATALAKAQMQALDTPTWPEQAKAQPALTPEPPDHPSIPAQFIVRSRADNSCTMRACSPWPTPKAYRASQRILSV